MRLVFVFDPAGELDHAVADRPDVDGALGENRIVAERLEHAVFEPSSYASDSSSSSSMSVELVVVVAAA